MKFELVSSGGDVLDTFTITGKTVSYETKRAEPIVDKAIARYGIQFSQNQFRAWSNGYVSTREVIG